MERAQHAAHTLLGSSEMVAGEAHPARIAQGVGKLGSLSTQTTTASECESTYGRSDGRNDPGLRGGIDKHDMICYIHTGVQCNGPTRDGSAAKQKRQNENEGVRCTRSFHATVAYAWFSHILMCSKHFLPNRNHATSA